MKIDIPYYIRQVLREQRKVYIPDVGTFHLVQSHARISNDKSSIHPPILDIDFSDGTSDDQSLRKYIQDTNQFSNTNIDSSISDFTQLIYNDLINVKVNKIDGLGSLIRNEELDTVTFDPMLGEFTKEYKNLIPLSITPIDRIKEEIAVSHAVDTQGQVIRPESKFRWLQPIIAGILIAALIIFCKKCSESDSMMYINPDASSEASENNETEEMADTFFDEAGNEKGLELESEYKEVDKMLDDASNSELADESTVEIDEDKLDKELEVLEENPEIEIQSDPIAEDEAVEKDGVKVISDTPIGERIAKNTPAEQINKYANVIPESGKCIIILASLKKATNITRMISLIERDGKKAYTSQYKGKTRVGFSFECSNVDIDDYLNDIRKRLSSKAWYLDPTIAIPYK